MANGQTLGGGFDPRFQQAPIVEGQPVGTVPTLGGQPALSSGQTPASPQAAQDDPRKQAQEDARNLADIQGNLGLRIKELVREAERNPTLARNIIQATGTLIREYEKTRDLRKQVEKTAGISTLRADVDSDKILGLIAKIPITFSNLKADERRIATQGGKTEVAIPARVNVPQGAVESTGGVAGVRGQPALGRAPKIKAVFDTTTKQPRFASEQEILQSNGVLQPLPTGFEIKTNADGSVSILSGTRRGEDKEGESREQLVSIQNMSRRALGLIDMVQKGGADVLATSGFLSQLKSGFDAQAKSVAKKFGLSLNIESFDFPGLNEDAVNARLIKSAVLDLAIMKAQAIGLGSGRALSDKDIQQQINTLSGGFGDPNVVIANIKQATANVALDFQQKRRILFDEPTFDIRSELGPGSEAFFDEQEASAPKGEIEDLPDGTVVVQNGVRFVIQGGQAIPQ